ncbi:MAG: HIT family protein, partial [Deltaproteobacteria bacterium]|nr:HIT family protein [Deltaproteobacteria bacterium]
GVNSCLENLKGSFLDGLRGNTSADTNNKRFDPGPSLIIPRRHVESFFDLHGGERNALLALLDEMKSDIQHKDETVEGFNVGINNGEVAGQSVPHVHVHLIPRRRGDVEHPRGGVRGVIPRKASY